MKETDAEKWKKARESGPAAWIIKRGVLGWGLAMCAGFVVMQWLRQPENLTHILMVNVPLWLGAGAAWGASTWYAMERVYQRYLAKHGEPGL